MADRANCLDENAIVALFRGTLSADQASSIEAHIDACASCRMLVSRFASKDEETRADVAPGAPADYWAEGTLFGDRFELQGFLAGGGMGQIYRAKDRQTEAAVAIKVLQRLGDEDLSRFEREMRLLAQLSHPAIVRYVGRGDAPDGSPFMAMEWLEGEDLAQRLAREPLTVDETRRLGAAIAVGLARAHAVGVVHRDIKPSNIFLRDGDVTQATIVDFGVACGAPTDTVPATLTRTGALLGTLAYMAPEQARGAKDVDGRADVFSLGCVLFECLTGARPFQGAHAVEVLAKILADPAPRPIEVATAVPADLDDLVSEMLAKDPAERPSDCGEIAERLRTTSALTRRRRGPRVSRRAWILVALALAALGTAGLGRLGVMRAVSVSAAPPPSATVAARPAFHPVRPRRITFDEQCAEFPSFTADSRSVVYDATVGADSFIFVKDVGGGAATKLTSVNGWDMAPAVSPDGAQIAFMRFADGAKQVMVIDRAGRSPPRALAAGINARPSWSRDGRSIWTGNNVRLERYDVLSGALLEAVPLPAGVIARATKELADGGLLVALPLGKWSGQTGLARIGADRSLSWLVQGDVDEVLATSPDGQRALTARLRATGESELIDVPVDGSPSTSLATSGVAPRKGLDFSPDGRLVAWSTCASMSQLVTVSHGEPKPLLSGWQWNEVDIAWIQGTRRAVVLSSRGGGVAPWVVDLDDPTAPRPIPVGDLQPVGVSVSDDGALLAFTAFERGLYVVPVDGSAPPRGLTRDSRDFSASFAHGSRDVVFQTVHADGRLQIAKVSTDGGEPTVIVERDARSPSASPVDARVLYLAGAKEGELVPMIVDPKTSRSAAISPALGPGPYRALRFTPDGKRAIVLKNEPEQLEIDLASGAILSKSTLDAAGVSFVDDKIVFASRRWAGDLWVADEPFAP